MKIDPNFLIIFPLLFSILVLIFRKHSKQIGVSSSIINLSIVGLLYLSETHDFYVSNWALKGVHLIINSNSKLMLLMVSVVFLSVIVNSLKKNYNYNFYFFSLVFLASVNASMISYDLFNIYVVIELASLSAYLLIGYKQKKVQLWASLKYLVLSSVALNFYLLGIGILYAYNRTFDISNLRIVPEISIVFILSGLLAKSGIFFMSMWLPLAHSQAETEVSALLSGIFVKIGAFQIIKLLSLNSFATARPFVSFVAIVSSIVGVIYAFNEKNSKKILAYSTLSQMGFVLSGISFANILHMFNHGIFKSLLFLTVGDSVEDYSKKTIQELKEQKIPLLRNIALKIAVFGIIGMPFLSGFVSKTMIEHEATITAKIGLSIAAIGTTATFWKFTNFRSIKVASMKVHEYLGYLILTFFIISVGISGSSKMEFKDILKSVALILAGIVVYKIFRPVKFSKSFEKLDNALLLYIVFCVIGLSFFFIF